MEQKNKTITKKNTNKSVTKKAAKNKPVKSKSGNKKKISTRVILIPVFVIGFVSVISSIWSLRNLSKVNDAASQIVDNSLV